MLDIFETVASSFLLFLVVCPIVAWALLCCIWRLSDVLGAHLKKDKKLQAWGYYTLIIMLFSLLIMIFSY